MTRAVRVIGWWAVLLVLAAMCVWSALDRLAGQGLLVRAPASLLTGGHALIARAAQAQARGNAAAAQTLAAAALRRRPIDPAALRVAGFAAILAGRGARGDALMRLAGAAGWRDGPTQLYWAEAALDAGALDVAAQRLDAVRRAAKPGSAAGLALLQRLEATPAGRAALVERLAGPGQYWAGEYLERLDGLDPAAIDHRIATVTLAARAGVTDIDRDRLGWALVDRDRADLAARLAGVGVGAGPVFAFAPVASGARPGPFAWTIDGQAGIDATVARRGAGYALHVQADGPSLLPLASRLVRLSPGSTRLALSIEGARTTMPLIATLRCLGTGTATAQPIGSGSFGFVLSVPPTACATQALGLAVAGEEARRGTDLWLAAPVLTRAAGAP